MSERVQSKRFSNPENSRLYRWGLAAVGILFGMLTVVALLAQPMLALVPVAIGLASMWLLGRLFGRSCLEVGPDGLTVVNPFSRHEVPWNEVKAVFGGRLLRTDLVSGGLVHVWAVQNANSDSIRNRDGYADLVAKELQEAHP